MSKRFSKLENLYPTFLPQFHNRWLNRKNKFNKLNILSPPLIFN